jgi:triosephosphate isomerase
VSARNTLVAGNWKLNGSRASAAELATGIASGAAGLDGEILVCPGFAHLADVQVALDGSTVALGAQNCSIEASGAFTGEVAAPMIAEFGAQYVIVGHSERRSIFGESSAVVAQKAQAVQHANLTPIVCVGETLQQREAGELQAVMDEQLDAVLDTLGIDGFKQMVVAYEPVWAIGTGKTASSEQAQEVHVMIRNKLAALDAAVAQQLRILYGGSVKPDNAQELFAQPDIDGGLIGGASLDAESFLGICQAAG